MSSAKIKIFTWWKIDGAELTMITNNSGNRIASRGNLDEREKEKPGTPWIVTNSYLLVKYERVHDIIGSPKPVKFYRLWWLNASKM